MDELTIIRQRPHCVEIPWTRFLLGGLGGEVVDDPERRLVLPHSLMLCDRPDSLTPAVLREVRRVGTVGLFHVSDEWYKASLDAYPAFAFVWRNHLHTGLRGRGIRQLPLGPSALDEVTADPLPAARRPPHRRRHVWSFVGELKTSRFAMLRSLRRVPDGREVVTGVYDDRRTGVVLGRADYLDVLADSVFAPCGMGHAHVESFRVYEALEMGAIPIVERRPWLDYFRELFGDHPMPSVRSWSQAPGLIDDLRSDETRLGELQARVVEWWSATKRDLATAAQRDVQAAFAAADTAAARTDAAGVAPRWRGRVEMLRHHNPGAVWHRLNLTRVRIVRAGTPRRHHRSRAPG